MNTWADINIKGQGHLLTLIKGHSDLIFENLFSLETLCRLKANFIWNRHGIGEWKFIQMVQVTWQIWPPCPYILKNLKIFFSGTERPMTLNIGIQHRVLEYYQSYSNDDPWLALTYFKARSNLVPCAFVLEKGKTMDFSKTILVYDIKVGMCSQLN